jgi:uncharacterized protein YcnI
MSRLVPTLARRVLVPPTCAGLVVLATAVPAVAHVSVSSPDAEPGGFGKLVIRVPTESATASTTRLRVTLPRSTPFANVSVRPVTGWTVAFQVRRLDKPVTSDDGFTLTRAVSTVTWTAGAGHGIKPGEFDEFELSVGPFPRAAASVALPTVQTYSDGTVVRWDQPPAAGKPEPAHPVPTLSLSSAPRSPAASAPADSSDAVARWLGGAGVVLGVAAVVVTVAGRTPGSRRRP